MDNIAWVAPLIHPRRVLQTDLVKIVDTKCVDRHLSAINAQVCNMGFIAWTASLYILTCASGHLSDMVTSLLQLHAKFTTNGLCKASTCLAKGA